MRSQYRSFFWPAVLILAGLLALLVNTGAISTDRLILLVNLWPLILVVVGLELIVRRGLHGAAADVAAALVVILAIGGAAAYIAISPNPAVTGKVDASAPLGELRKASLEVNVGSATVNMTGGSDLGTLLYRAHVEYPGPKPDITFDESSGDVSISQRSEFPFNFQALHVSLNIELNPAIPWTITENTGASKDSLDLVNVKVSALTLNVGAATENIVLGPPTGIVSVEINGGALTVHVHRPSGVEASVSVSGGAVNLIADGHASHAIGDVNYASSGFAGATDAYRLTVSGGACTVTLDKNAVSD